MGPRPRKSIILACFLGVIVYFIIYRIIENGSNNRENVDKSKMDHSHHDHSAHMHAMDAGREHVHGGDEGECDSMHAMVFHIGVCQDILFPGWTSTNAGQMVGACVVVFIAAALYEGLKCWRDHLFRKGLQTINAQSQMNITKECGSNGSCANKVVKYKMLSVMHVIQTLLHMLQVFMSYLLMLIFMTYNVWLCIALILGTGLGYFLCAWQKQSVVDLTEHCH